MNNPSQDVMPSDRSVMPIQRRKRTEVAEDIHVLSVGPVDRSCMIHDALLEVPYLQISMVRGYRELWMLPEQETIQVAILHDALRSFELEAGSRLIRRRWPRARILMLRSQAGSVDGALYDELLPTNLAPQVLLAAIRRLAAAVRRSRSRYEQDEVPLEKIGAKRE